jgi:hypothetical protein
MEKAMQKSHGMGYAEYSRKLEMRIKVEKRREKEYAKSRKILGEVDSSLT